MASTRDPVGPFLHYLMAECGVSPNTLAAYRADILRFGRWRKDNAPGPLPEIPVSVLSRYVDHLNSLGLAPSSVGRHLASLSTFFRYLIFDGKMTENLAKLLVAPAVWDRLPTVMSPQSIDRLLSGPSADTRLGRRDRAALETLYATGCRASEVIGLRPRDIDLEPTTGDNSGGLARLLTVNADIAGGRQVCGLGPRQSEQPGQGGIQSFALQSLWHGQRAGGGHGV